MNRQHVLSGIDRIEQADGLLRGRRVGLMTNPTGVDHGLKSTIDIVNSRYRLTALYAVEHGIRGDAQAGAKVENTVDPETGVTVYSAYGKDSHFNEEMLAAFDVLVFDIQDVGARFYTYLYSLAYAMEACARAGKSMVVLDRVNPVKAYVTESAGVYKDAAWVVRAGDEVLCRRKSRILTPGESQRVEIDRALFKGKDEVIVEVVK